VPVQLTPVSREQLSEDGLVPARHHLAHPVILPPFRSRARWCLNR
jgi:hypothetical protein